LVKVRKIKEKLFDSNQWSAF